MKPSRIVGIVAFLLALASARAGNLAVFPLFTDHGILQQDTTVTIWGAAKPGASVSVTFCETTATTTADSAGKWLAHLKTPKAKPGYFDGYELTIASTDERLVLRDVAVGEVWIGGGQSNIDTELSRYAVGVAEIPNANHPGIRLYSRNGKEPTGDFSKFHWDRCSPAVVGKASAAGYFFSRELQKTLNVPVGFVNMAVGGSPLSGWVKPEWLAADPRMAANFEEFRTKTFPAFIADRQKKLSQWEASAAAAKAKGEKPNPAWPPFQGLADQPLESFVGGLHATHTANVIPFVFKGMLWDQGESGVGLNLKGAYDIVFEIMLQHLRKDFGYDLPVVYCQMPKGGAWAPNKRVLIDKPGFAEQGDALQPLADLPAVAPKAGPVFESFAKESDPFLRMNALPGCFMATTRDLQAALHPPDKDAYGARFCLVALDVVYGRKMESFGPMIASVQRKGSELRLEFSHVGTGLVVPGDKPLQGFYVTAADGVSTWVSGRIEGNQVVLSGPAVAAAKSISYAHTSGGRVPWANLFNREGLPAYPMTVNLR